MNKKHTPGPWSWWSSNSFLRLTAENGRDGGVLSARPHSDGCATVAVGEADACLIAAAPDLLKELQELDAVLEAAWNARELPASVVSGEQVRRYRAAIAKATGAL
jgi:hypothetical protein